MTIYKNESHSWIREDTDKDHIGCFSKMPTWLLQSSASGKNRPHLHGSLFSDLASASHAPEMALSKVITGLLMAAPSEYVSLLIGLKSILTASLKFSWLPR